MGKIGAASEKPSSGERPSDLSREAAFFSPSPFVKRFAAKIAQAAAGKPILDIGCGSGRNAVPFLQLGCRVICLDKDLSCLNVGLLTSTCQNPPVQLVIQRFDLASGEWPFKQNSIGGIISVHLTLPTLFPAFARSLFPGGYFLLESVPAHGGNYLELPKSGELKAHLEQTFVLESYRERRAGPPEYNAVTVRLLAARR